MFDCISISLPSVQNCAMQMRTYSSFSAGHPELNDFHKAAITCASLCERLLKEEKPEPSLLWNCGKSCIEMINVCVNSPNPWTDSCIVACNDCEVTCMNAGMEELFSNTMYNYSYL